MVVRLLAPLATVVFASASVLVSACSTAPDARQHGVDDERVGATGSAIISGKASAADQDAVVLLVSPIDSTSAFECTGTLIAPNLVLTARHCVAKTTEAAFACDEKGGGTAGGAVGSDFPATNVLVFAGVKRPADPFKGSDAKGAMIFHDESKNLCNHDLALLLLDKPIENGKIASIRLDAPITKGEVFTAVGWGVTSTVSSPNVRQQRTDITINTVGPAADPKNGLALGPNEFLVGESICQGDSGGPALAATTGAVLGVVTRGGNNRQGDPNDPASQCVDGVNFYTMTSGFKDLILTAFTAAGHDPWTEGGPDPRLAKLGEACTGPESCRSALCLTDAKGVATTCTQSCATEKCPEGLECTTRGADKLCAPKGASANGAGGGTTTTTTTGCAVSSSGQGSSSSLAAWALAGLALIAARRRRSSPRSA